MRHRVAGRKLGRTSEHRKALLRNLSTALFDHEKITTTLAKAKALRPFAEKLVTMSKRESLHARRQVLCEIQDRKVVAKLFDTLSARYAQRPGGYTRIIKLGPRRGDNAEMALVELVDSEAIADAPATKTAKSKRTKRAKPEADAGEDAPAKKAKKAKTSKTSKTKAAGKGARTAKSSASKTSTKKTAGKSTKTANTKKGG